MDILSHGLWGGAPFYLKSRRKFWWAFFFGALPDLSSFGINFVAMILFPPENFHFGERPHMMDIPNFVNALYNISHSFFTFFAVFFIVYLLLRKPFWPMLAWGLHILMDVPTHNYEFFPTPFLWPLSSFKVDGFSWGQQWFLIMDFSMLVVLYAVMFLVKRARKAKRMVDDK